MSGVYILYDPNSQFVKIGRATNLEDRLANLRTANPRLEVVDWYETSFDSAVEAYVHARLACQRREGEFFNVSPELAREEIAEALIWMDKRPTSVELEAVVSEQDLVGSRDATSQEVQTLTELLELRAEIQKLQLKESVLLDRLKVAVGRSAGLHDWLVFSPVMRMKVDLNGLREEAPEMVEKHTLRFASRTLRIQRYIRQK